MKEIAIFSRGLSMNGANKSLIELLKRLDYSILKLDLYILDFDNSSTDLIKSIPREVNVIIVPRYKLDLDTILNIIIHPFHFIEALLQHKNLFSDKLILQWNATAKRLPVIRKKYDVAISYRHFDIDVFYVMKNIKSKKKIFWIHGIQQMDSIEKDLLFKIYKKYNLIVAVSNTAKNNFINQFPKLENKIKVAYCIVDGKEIKNKMYYGETFENNKFNILTISRLGKEKGIDLAVNACEILIKQGFDFEWTVLGEGSQRKYLENLIKEKNLEKFFILKGEVSNPYNYLRCCDIYVQPSYLESFGLTINEAKIMNKPIVCTNIPAFNEQLKNGVTGIFCELNANSLAVGIKSVIDDKKLRDKLCAELSKNDYSSTEAVDFFNKYILKNM